jgi:hypothetical protein
MSARRMNDQARTMKGKFHTTEGKIGMLPETGSGPFKENFQGLRNRSKEGSETRTQSPLPCTTAPAQDDLTDSLYSKTAEASTRSTVPRGGRHRS